MELLSRAVLHAKVLSRPYLLNMNHPSKRGSRHGARETKRSIHVSHIQDDAVELGKTQRLKPPAGAAGLAQLYRRLAAFGNHIFTPRSS